MSRARRLADPAPTNAATHPALPDGWQWVRFDQIALNITERVDDPKKAGVDHYVGLEHLDSNSLKIRRWGTPDDVEAQKLRFRKGDIIFGKRRAYQRKVGIAAFDGICSAHAFVFRGNAKHIVPDLLPFFMQTEAFMERAVAISKGSLSPTINWRDLARQEFALPSDPAEQRRIAELLRAAEEACQTFITLLDSLRSLRDSEVHRFFGSVVGSTGKKRLGSYFKERRETGFKGLEILAVTINGRVVPRDSLERTVHDDTGTEKYMRVLPGDFAYNTMRMWQGSCGQVHQEGLISPAYTAITPTKEELPQRFWELLFSYPPMLMWFQRYSTGVASDRWRLYFRAFAKIPVEMPDTLYVKAFVQHVQAIDLQIADVDKAIEYRKNLYLQLLSNLLTLPSETP